MNRISITQQRALFLISLTFLAMPIELILCRFESFNMPSMNLFNLLMLYLFSLFLPAIGLVVFVKNTRNNSSRWYWGIPLLVGVILNTFLRDAMFMFPFNSNADNIIYGQSFIATFPILYKWHILEYLSPNDSAMNSMIMFSISIFFSFAAALFSLSVPEEKRKKFKLPCALSLVAVISNLIQFLVGRQPYSPLIETMAFYSFAIFSLAIFYLGISFIVTAVNYEHIMPDAVKLG